MEKFSTSPSQLTHFWCWPAFNIFYLHTNTYHFMACFNGEFRPQLNVPSIILKQFTNMIENIPSVGYVYTNCQWGDHGALNLLTTRWESDSKRPVYQLFIISSISAHRFLKTAEHQLPISRLAKISYKRYAASWKLISRWLKMFGW